MARHIFAAIVREPVYQTLGSFEFRGESINEGKIVIGDEDSAGLCIEGDYPEEDGILAGLFTAKAVAARGASLTEQSGRVMRTNRMCEGRFIFCERYATVDAAFGDEPTVGIDADFRISRGLGGAS